MNSIRQFFSYLNDINFKYVVLRNWENLPNDVHLGEHSDLDLLVYDYDHFFELFPKAQKVYALPRVRTKIPIADSYLYADVRFVGDNYYPEHFEKSILESREWHERGFFTCDYTHHVAALAYHAVHHKNCIAPEYKKYLGDSTLGELLESLKSSSIGWVEPNDHTVGKFNGYWKGATSVVQKESGKIIKSQKNFKDYDLIKNEYEILSKCKSSHFPKVYMIFQGQLAIEDCGKHLSPEMLPENWKQQLFEIQIALKENKITHRDIRLDNLMIKDGIIKLIDFGWAIKDGVEEMKEAPSCLGFPNKPSWGYDDAYSLGRVAKQIEFMLEPEEAVA